LAEPDKSGHNFFVWPEIDDEPCLAVLRCRPLDGHLFDDGKKGYLNGLLSFI